VRRHDDARRVDASSTGHSERIWARARDPSRVLSTADTGAVTDDIRFQDEDHFVRGDAVSRIRQEQRDKLARRKALRSEVMFTAGQITREAIPNALGTITGGLGPRPPGRRLRRVQGREQRSPG